MKKNKQVSLSIPVGLAEVISRLARLSDTSTSDLYAAAVFKLLMDVDYDNDKPETHSRTAFRLRSVVSILYNQKWDQFVNYQRVPAPVEGEAEDLVELDETVLKPAQKLNPEQNQQYFDKNEA